MEVIIHGLNTLIWARTYAELVPRVKLVLDRCRQHNVTISKNKLDMGTEIMFTGHVISNKGIRTDPDRLWAIRDFPRSLRSSY